MSSYRKDFSSRTFYLVFRRFDLLNLFYLYNIPFLSSQYLFLTPLIMNAVHFRGRVFFCVAVMVSFFSLFSAPATYAAATNSGVPVAGNNMGINIGGTSDWMGERLYADLIKMSRSFNQVNTNANGAKIAVDSNGWPLSDTSFYIWHGIDQMHGAYALSFSGKAVVTGAYVGSIPMTYDTLSNTSQGSFTYSGTG